MSEQHGVAGEFHQVVNMTADELEQWLQNPESKATGMTRPGEEEAVGHQRCVGTGCP